MWVDPTGCAVAMYSWTTAPRIAVFRSSSIVALQPTECQRREACSPLARPPVAGQRLLPFGAVVDHRARVGVGPQLSDPSRHVGVVGIVTRLLRRRVEHAEVRRRVGAGACGPLPAE